MPVYSPDSDAHALSRRLDEPHRGLVLCFCAAWCDTCCAYRQKFVALSGHYADWVFVWVDIENHPELLGDEDVENFPTLLLIVEERTRFFGPMLPHLSHLQRLLDVVDAHTPEVHTALAPDLTSLLAGSGNRADQTDQANQADRAA